MITAINDEIDEMNVAIDPRPSPGQSTRDTIPNVAKRFKARGTPWALVVGENYGEGSAREHAALQPRFYGAFALSNSISSLNLCKHPGCKLIVAQSFARIHETNLKKQGVLPLWFSNKDDYKRICAGDSIATFGLADLIGKDDTLAKVFLRVTKPDGQELDVPVRHSLSKDQIKWLKAGSALNAIRQA